jgi:hypothetical protein
MSFEYAKITLWIDMKARRIFISSVDRLLPLEVQHKITPYVNRFLGLPERLLQ